MKSNRLILAASLLLTSCTLDTPTYPALDEQLVCDSNGNAYMVNDGVGQVRFLKRFPLLDNRCSKIPEDDSND